MDKIIILTTISIIIALLWVSVIPAFSQFSAFPWDLDPIATYDSEGHIYLTNEDLAYTIFNPNHLQRELHGNPAEFGCRNNIDSEDEYENISDERAAALERQEESRLLMTYTDLKNNTVKIYCQWNPWLGEDERLRQYTAFYNDKILVGLCPFNDAVNRHEIHTDEEGEIERTVWVSVRQNGSDYTIQNNYFS